MLLPTEIMESFAVELVLTLGANPNRSPAEQRSLDVASRWLREHTDGMRPATTELVVVEVF